MLHAPAGYGKTAVLTEWAATDPRPCAWLSLTAAHDDADVLAGDLRAAIAGTQPAGADETAWLAQGAASPDRRGRARPFLLVVDDLDVVTAVASLELLGTVTTTVPSGSQVALASRTPPNAVLRDLRVTSNVVEMTADDLTLDPRETRLLLAGTGLPAATVDSIIQSTEGWPAAVSLAGRAALGAPDHPPALGGGLGVDRVILDYLRTEMWSDLDHARMRFLTHTSILGKLTGPLCDAVLGTQGSGTVLAELRRNNIAVTPLDRIDERYRYHPLLAAALQGELSRAESALVPVLHGRASRFFHAHGDPDAAIAHAVNAGDPLRLGRLVWAHTRLGVVAGRLDPLRRSLETLTNQQVTASPELAVLAAWAALLGGDRDAVIRWTTTAEAQQGHHWRGDIAGSETRAALALLLAWRGTGGVSGMHALASTALTALPADSCWRPLALYLTAAATALTGRVTQTRDALHTAEELARVFGAHLVHAQILATLSLQADTRGDRHTAARLAGQAQSVIDGHQLADLPAAGPTMSAIAMVHARTGAAAAAAHALSHARRLTAAPGGAPWLDALARLLQASTSLLLRDAPTARALARQARELLGVLDAPTIHTFLDQTDTAIASTPPDPANGDLTALTTAEQRVLQYLPTHLTGPQIGHELFLSRHTVKTQTLSVYRKLGATTRAEAVSRAHTLGLLPSPPTHIGPRVR